MTESSTTPSPPEDGQLDPEELEQVAGGEGEGVPNMQVPPPGTPALDPQDSGMQHKI